jgi:hypothetical protein
MGRPRVVRTLDVSWEVGGTMNRETSSDRIREPRTDARREERDSPERSAAPPIEREHETYAGVFEEDERRERERR